jgi:hypothetical protein
MLRVLGIDARGDIVWRLRFVPAAALIAAAAVISGCETPVAGVSETCTQPTALEDGFFANRAVFFRVATQPKPTDPSTTWVCYRVKVAGAVEKSGRIDVNATTETPAVRLTTDLSSRACTSTTPNAVPAPHPIRQGEVLDTPFYVDAYGSLLAPGPGDAAWLCVEAGPVKERVRVERDDTPVATAVLNADSSPPPPQDTTPPPAGKASTTCSAGAYGPATEVVNAHLSGRDLFLYTARPADDEVHLCARISSPGDAGGGHLAVKAAASQVVDVQQSADISPCTQDVVVLSDPPMSIRRSPLGQTPPSICVNDTRYTIVTGPVPPIVSFEADS